MEEQLVARRAGISSGSDVRKNIRHTDQKPNEFSATWRSPIRRVLPMRALRRCEPSDRR